jgi:hypothetical protein
MLRRKSLRDAEPLVAFGKVEKLESSVTRKEVSKEEVDWETTGSGVVGSGRKSRTIQGTRE